jgi:hypothetical protein
MSDVQASNLAENITTLPHYQLKQLCWAPVLRHIYRRRCRTLSFRYVRTIILAWITIQYREKLSYGKVKQMSARQGESYLNVGSLALCSWLAGRHRNKCYKVISFYFWYLTHLGGPLPGAVSLACHTQTKVISSIWHQLCVTGLCTAPICTSL